MMEKNQWLCGEEGLIVRNNRDFSGVIQLFHTECGGGSTNLFEFIGLYI